jgi:hypothetical protein
MSITPEQMLAMQRSLQNRYGKDPGSLVGDERAAYVRDMVLAVTDELHEALGETGWKPWASSRHLNRAEYMGELVDVWHFFMNLLLVANITWDEFSDAYISKNAENIRRQELGLAYDGIQGKCPACKRDLGDIEKVNPGIVFLLYDEKTYCTEFCALEDGYPR